MLNVYAADVINDLQRLKDALDPQWTAAWSTCHKIGKSQAAACASLMGLYLLSRAGMRGILDYEVNGRPLLRGTEVDFSISHTGEKVFCALLSHAPMQDARVGLDAEQAGRLSNGTMQALAERWFAKGERERFAAETTEDSFLRIWTRKEAYVKMTGEGMRDLQRTDTVALAKAGNCSFYEYRVDGVFVTICAPRGTVFPTEIQITDLAGLK